MQRESVRYSATVRDGEGLQAERDVYMAVYGRVQGAIVMREREIQYQFQYSVAQSVTAFLKHREFLHKELDAARQVMPFEDYREEWCTLPWVLIS
jgi:hypothetical protein